MAVGTIWADGIWADDIWADGIWGDATGVAERTVAGSEGGESATFSDETNIWHPIEGEEGGEEGAVENISYVATQALPVVAGVEGGETATATVVGVDLTAIDGTEGGETGDIAIDGFLQYALEVTGSEGGESARFRHLGTSTAALPTVIRRRRRHPRR